MPCQAFSSPSVSFTPSYQACEAVPTLLIKYPKGALVFQLGCFLSVHYWHVFNNSSACAAEDTPPWIWCFNSSQSNCVHLGKMNLKFAFALNFSNRPKCQVRTETGLCTSDSAAVTLSWWQASVSFAQRAVADGWNLPERLKISR